MANTYEPLINVVSCDKPKVLSCLQRQLNPIRVHRLGPKGEGSGMGAPNSPIADVELPAKRRSLTHAGTCTERVKPIGLPPVYCRRGSEPQGTPMGLWVKDGGRSECPLVMRGIGVASCDVDREQATRQHHSTRKRADFLSRSLVT